MGPALFMSKALQLKPGLLSWAPKGAEPHSSASPLAPKLCNCGLAQCEKKRAASDKPEATIPWRQVRSLFCATETVKAQSAECKHSSSNRHEAASLKRRRAVESIRKSACLKTFPSSGLQMSCFTQKTLQGGKHVRHVQSSRAQRLLKCHCCFFVF